MASVLGPMPALDLYAPPVAAWWTVFTAVVVQGVPFLLLGTVVSAAIGAFVPERVFTRLLPRRQALAVPVAGAAGVVLPVCECASVPVAGSLMRRGVAPAASAGRAAGGEGRPPADAWVTVTGTWHPKGALGSDAAWPPVLDAAAVPRVAQPASPYEKCWRTGRPPPR